MLDCARLHEATLRLLEATGVAFQAQEAQEVFQRHGFRVEGARVFIPEGRLRAALESAPARFVLRGRGRQPDLVIGQGGAVLASASGCPYAREADGTIRPGRLADFETAVQLGQLLPALEMNGRCVEAQDLPVEVRHRRELWAGLTMSDKALEYPLARPDHVPEAFTAQEILFGADWDREVRFLAVLNSFSPLRFSPEMAYAAVRTAERGQAVCITPAAMAGMSAPATLAGVLVTQNAEALAGLVLVQLVRPGCPFVYGGTSSLASMATGDFLAGVPQYWSLVRATVELAHWYGLPCRAGGALTDAHVPDFQAGMESALSLSAALEAGVDYVLHAFGALGNFNIFSAEKLLLDAELALALRAANQPVGTLEDDLALEETVRVATGDSSFLLEEHTLRHCRDFERSSFLNRANLDAWQKRGGRAAPAAATARVTELLQSYQAPEMDALTRRQLQAYCLS